MPATKISLAKAKQNKLFYVVANVMVYRDSDQRCLILKRDERETAHPGKWACPGGKLEWKDLDIEHPTRLNGDILDYEDAIEKLCKREALEESGVEIEGPLRYINTNVFIRPDEVPVMLIKFAARYQSGKVRPEPGGFTDFAWVNAAEVQNYPCILGIPEEVAATIELFTNQARKKEWAVSRDMQLQVGVKVIIKSSQGLYLLIQRSSKLPGDKVASWDIPGGRIMPNEDLRQALAREIQEEIGTAIIGSPELITAQDIFAADKGIHVVRLTYLLAMDIDQISLSAEHVAYRWVTPQEASELAEPYLKEALRIMPKRYNGHTRPSS